MAVRGGDIRQLTVDSREYSVMAEASVNIDAGGFSNENTLTGNGSLHTVQKRKVAGFSDCAVSIDDTIQDLEFLQNISDSGSEVPVTMTLASGITYSGSLAFQGDLIKASGEGSATLEMRGAKFTQI